MESVGELPITVFEWNNLYLKGNVYGPDMTSSHQLTVATYEGSICLFGWSYILRFMAIIYKPLEMFYVKDTNLLLNLGSRSSDVLWNLRY
jgi:hypothetical protein